MTLVDEMEALELDAALEEFLAEERAASRKALGTQNSKAKKND